MTKTIPSSLLAVNNNYHFGIVKLRTVQLAQLGLIK